MELDDNVSSNGSTTGPTGSNYPSYVSTDWRDAPEQEHLDLSKESLETQAAMQVLNEMHAQTYLGFFVGQQDRRLACAKEMARVHDQIEKVLRSDNNRWVT